MSLILETQLVFVLYVFIYMFVWFVLAIIKKRNDLADIAWGLGFLLISILSFLKFGPSIDRGLLITLLVSLWALRLSTHIYLRNRNKTEDFRYKAWRDLWGKWFYVRTFLQVFLLQGFLLLLIITPVIIVNIYRGPTYLNWIDIVGLIIWVIGFFFESVGDWQLTRFIKNKNNQNKILQSGLWKYTRHPNYFGEVTQWWGLWIISLSVPYGFWGIIGPITISFLILKISGIPLLEKKYASNLEFQEYKKRTSVFFPLPSKKQN